MSQVPVAPSREMLLEEFHAVVAETEQLLKSVASLGSDTAGVLKGNVDDVIATATDRVAGIRDRSLAQATAAAEAAEAYVKQNPWRAVGIVALVTAATGLVAGLLIARR